MLVCTIHSPIRRMCLLLRSLSALESRCTCRGSVCILPLFRGEACLRQTSETSVVNRPVHSAYRMSGTPSISVNRSKRENIIMGCYNRRHFPIYTEHTAKLVCR